MYPDAGAAAVMRDLHCAHARYVWNLAVEQQSWWRPGRGTAPGSAERRLSRRWGEVHVPRCGWVRFRWTRQLPGRLGMARVTLDRAGRWHVSFPAPQPAVPRAPAGKPAGIDRGVRTALVTSDGQHYRAPRIGDRHARRYLGLQQRMARQQKGSAKRERTRRAMAKITAQVTDRRRFTSQQCRACGHTATENRDSQAVFRCVSCGHRDHADANAAKNILARGLAIASSCASPGARGVRPCKPEQSAAGTTREAA